MNGDASSKRVSFLEDHLMSIRGQTEAVATLTGRLEDLADRLFGPVPAANGTAQAVPPPTGPGVTSSLKDAMNATSLQIVRLDAVVNRLRDIA